MQSSDPISILNELSPILLNMGYTQSEIEEFQKEVINELKLANKKEGI